MPKSKKLRLSGPAIKDIGRIGEYTGREWGAAQKRKYLGLIKAGLKAIRATPGLGAPRDDIGKGRRAHPVRKHLIYYRETKTGLVIVRVLHENMDPGRHLSAGSGGDSGQEGRK